MITWLAIGLILYAPLQVQTDAKYLLQQYPKPLLIAFIRSQRYGYITIQQRGLFIDYLGKPSLKLVTPNTIEKDLTLLNQPAQQLINQLNAYQQYQLKKQHQQYNKKPLPRFAAKTHLPPDRTYTNTIERFQCLAEKQRNLRAARMGISRKTLDRMEHYPDITLREHCKYRLTPSEAAIESMLDAKRDKRALQQGISRQKLDQIEGR